jgi:predicted RNA-binding protein
MPAVDPVVLAELDNRIAILRDNLRELVEQAAAYSGAADESRIADRIADQQAKLDELLAERDKLMKTK